MHIHAYIFSSWKIKLYVLLVLSFQIVAYYQYYSTWAHHLPDCHHFNKLGLFSIEKMATHGFRKIKTIQKEFYVKKFLFHFTLEILLKDWNIPWNSCTINLFNHFPIDRLLFGFVEAGDFAFSNSASVYILVHIP